MSTMRMFGAPAGRWRGAGSGLYTDSCIVRLAMLPEGLGGNGRTSCAIAGVGVASVKHVRLVASNSPFVTQEIAALADNATLMGFIASLLVCCSENQDGLSTYRPAPRAVRLAGSVGNN